MTTKNFLSTNTIDGVGVLEYPSPSLGSIFIRYKWRILLTLMLVVFETILELLYPLFIGWAINDLLNKSYDGVYLLAILGAMSVIVGTARRFYDTRIYARIYQTIAPEMVIREKTKKHSVSTITARSNLLTEFVEFFENAMPEVITATIGVVGVLIIVSTLNTSVFLACLSLLMLVVLIYLVIGRVNYRLNTGFNGELERQVDAIRQSDLGLVQSHFRRLMDWKIKLSDLETISFFVLWVGVVILFVYTPVAAIGDGIVDYGLIVALLMYVLDLIAKISSLPLYIQHVIRLREIANRIRM